MKKEEVIRRLCQLASRVNQEGFRWAPPSDCFCGEKSKGPETYQFSEQILKFIEDAVNKAITEKVAQKRAAVVDSLLMEVQSAMKDEKASDDDTAERIAAAVQRYENDR